MTEATKTSTANESLSPGADADPRPCMEFISSRAKPGVAKDFVSATDGGA
jgi:hypothetical protein